MSSDNGAGPAPRYDLAPLYILVPEHALDRWEERLGVRPEREEVRQLVADAVFNARWSRERPRWLGGGTRREPNCAYVWPPSYEWCAVVILDTEPKIILRTVLVPSALEERTLRAGLLRWLRRQEQA